MEPSEENKHEMSTLKRNGFGYWKFRLYAVLEVRNSNGVF